MAIVWSYTKSTNLAVVTGGTSGTPATFATAVTADRAGSVTLKAASAPSLTFTLTYQITPVELRALIISFVIASKTTETDYIGITGTDAWDAAQTEVINVSAGNGTYASTKRFRTISNICCTDSATGAGGTVWANGTLAVTQPQWGVFWDWSEVNAVRMDCQVQIGDGSTPTYFKEVDRILLIGPGVYTGGWQSVFNMYPNAVLHFGNLIDETTKLVSQPCVISHITNPTYGGKIITGGVTYLYGTFTLGPASNWPVSEISGASRLWHCTNSNHLPMNLPAATDVFGIKSFILNTLHSPACSMAELISLGTNSGASMALWLDGSTNITVTNMKLYGHGFIAGTGASFSSTANLINVTTDHPEWHIWFNTGVAGIIYRKCTFDMKVVDNTGAALSGAAVDCEDQYATAAWTLGSVTTDVNGNIAQQTITVTKYTAGASESAPTVVTYSPHKITVSKAGYKSLVLENITIDEGKKWHVELQPYEGQAQSRIVSIGVM